MGETSDGLSIKSAAAMSVNRIRPRLRSRARGRISFTHSGQSPSNHRALESPLLFKTLSVWYRLPLFEVSSGETVSAALKNAIFLAV